ncbi:hypothetical protein BGZ81_011357 [Podila clonocystis]|nr:hypothetical protein BGZ81_011357 [Podila clonocystis]
MTFFKVPLINSGTSPFSGTFPMPRFLSAGDPLSSLTPGQVSEMLLNKDASNLVQRSSQLGRPIFVLSVNYRLNVFGFLASKDIQEDAAEYTKTNPDVSTYDQSIGNWRFMDVKLAFEWVRKNIQVFGGDDQNITAFGESAGSILVHFSIQTPTHYGLFDRAIMQSGTVSTIPAGIVRVEG